MSLDWTTVTTDKLSGMAAIVKKSPVFQLWKSGNRTVICCKSNEELLSYSM